LKLEWFKPIQQMRDEEYSFLDNFIRTKTYGDVLEIGQGGSTVILLDATKDTDRKIHSIDVKFKLKDTMKYLPLDYVERLKFIQEDSNNIHLKEKFGCILIDGNHSFSAVRKDTMNFWGNLDENGYMIFHDYGLQPGVTKFVDDWINYYKEARLIIQEHNLIVVQNV
tara:strand:+ start:1153 stop:1653 length:501 start_codon:yes stop_codon:yes gene_type:complete